MKGVPVAVVVVLVAGLGLEHRVAADDPAAALVGGWTLNRGLSSQAPDRAAGAGGGATRGGRVRGGFGRGGFGGGGRRGGFGGVGVPAVDPQEAARARAALRDLAEAPEHLTIVQADQLLVLTAQDGRATRLSPDGRPISDEASGLQRTTRWDEGKLVSVITGPGGLKVTESYEVDSERHQLRVTLVSADERRPLNLVRVYDADPR